MRHILTFLVIFSLGGFFIYRGGCSNTAQQTRPEDARVVEVVIDGHVIEPEVADTPTLRRKGLSERQDLVPGGGMLFVFEEDQKPEFWMKDTRVELSIAFIRADGTIIDIQQMKPQSPRRHSPPEPVRYALEVRRGWFEDRGLEPPVQVQLPDNLEIPAAEKEQEETGSESEEAVE
ncbi:MAG: DUF192 domain-containing protein [Planctomycetota bacterium]